MRSGWIVLLNALFTAGLVGCGTTRVTDSPRAATEMLLISQAVDNAVGQVDFSALKGKTTFLDSQYIDLTVDKGYVISSVRQHLLAHGAMLQETKDKADYVVELRAGAVGTDKNSLLVGTPQLTLPAVVPGVPTAVPEIALIKKTNQMGVAKLAVFAYNRTTGRALWQSGLVEANSSLKDTWIFGAGPISSGTIRREREFAGEALPKLPMPFVKEKEESADPLTTVSAHAQVFPGSDRPVPKPPVSLGATAIIGPVIAHHYDIAEPALPQFPLPPAGPVVVPEILPVGNIQPPSGPLPKPY